jgi:hypothetical protein
MCPISLNFEILNIECGGINSCFHRSSRKEGFHKHAVQLEAFSEETVRRQPCPLSSRFLRCPRELEVVEGRNNERGGVRLYTPAQGPDHESTSIYFPAKHTNMSSEVPYISCALMYLQNTMFSIEKSSQNSHFTLSF